MNYNNFQALPSLSTRDLLQPFENLRASKHVSVSPIPRKVSLDGELLAPRPLMTEIMSLSSQMQDIDTI